MARIRLSKENADYIATRIKAFAQEAGPEWHWELSAVAQFQALPLYAGWFETFAIRADGTVIRWSSGNEYEGWREVEEERDVRMSLKAGTERDPALAFLIPPRPTGARTCEHCGGSGYLPMPDHPGIFCVCGGFGWVDEQTAT
jgi:hypothetical protein